MSVTKSIVVLLLAGAVLVWWFLSFIHGVQAAHGVIP